MPASLSTTGPTPAPPGTGSWLRGSLRSLDVVLSCVRVVTWLLRSGRSPLVGRRRTAINVDKPFGERGNVVPEHGKLKRGNVRRNRHDDLFISIGRELDLFHGPAFRRE